jgi:peroxin-2
MSLLVSQEFLLFLLPIIRPRKLLRRLLRIPTHPLLLSFWLAILPRFISSKVGLYRDEKGKAKIKLPFAVTKSSSDADGVVAKYPDLPDNVCAICWERLEDEAGIKSSGQSMIRSGIPSSDPLDPSASALAPSTRTMNQHQPSTTTSSSSGLLYADAQIHTPYQAKPCGHRYCYVCIAGKLLSEEAAEDIADSKEDGDQISAWTCLRCAKGVASAEREEEQVALDVADDVKAIEEKST